MHRKNIQTPHRKKPAWFFAVPLHHCPCFGSYHLNLLHLLKVTDKIDLKVLTLVINHSTLKSQMQSNLVVVHKPSKILGSAGSPDLVQPSVRASMKLLLADNLHTDRKKIGFKVPNFMKVHTSLKTFHCICLLLNRHYVFIFRSGLPKNSLYICID